MHYLHFDMMRIDDSDVFAEVVAMVTKFAMVTVDCSIITNYCRKDVVKHYDKHHLKGLVLEIGKNTDQCVGNTARFAKLTAVLLDR